MSKVRGGIGDSRLLDSTSEKVNISSSFFVIRIRFRDHAWVTVMALGRSIHYCTPSVVCKRNYLTSINQRDCYQLVVGRCRFFKSVRYFGFCAVFFLVGTVLRYRFSRISDNRYRYRFFQHVLSVSTISNSSKFKLITY
jgi:hypothetical protein